MNDYIPKINGKVIIIKEQPSLSNFIELREMYDKEESKKIKRRKLESSLWEVFTKTY